MCTSNPSSAPSATSMAATQALDPYAAYPVVKNPDRSQWDKRVDGSDKGDGWLGVRKRPDGGVSSEISAGITINGKETEVPLMVPGLSKDELRYLMTNDPNLERNPDFFKKMPEGVWEKAEAHAKKRIAAGKSPFRGPDDKVAE